MTIELTQEEAEAMRVATTYGNPLYRLHLGGLVDSIGCDGMITLSEAGREALAAYDAKYRVIEADVLRTLVAGAESDGWDDELEIAVIKAQDVLGDNTVIPSSTPHPCDRDAILYLPLKRVYFEQIASGEKTHEFRLVTPYWRKRLVGRKYDKIVITCGYPKRGDSERTLVRKWMGEPEIQTIAHEHFGPEPVQVFAIDVREAIGYS